VQEAEGALGVRIQALPVRTRRFQQSEGADDVGLHESFRPEDRAVDVALGREVHDRPRLVRRQQLVDRRAIADVGLGKPVQRIVLQRRQVLQVPGIGQLVDIEDCLVTITQPVEYEVGADEPCPASHQNHMCPICLHRAPGVSAAGRVAHN
jgi:hypothetical protein